MIDLEHILRRLTDPFDPASRFYWPLVVAVFAAMVANVAWYYWRSPKAISSGSRRTREGAQDERAEDWLPQSPDEIALRPWALWINVIFLIWVLVLLIAKVPFWAIALSFVANIAMLVYIYAYVLPPREAAWAREQRRLRYIPKPERRRRRRR